MIKTKKMIKIVGIAIICLLIIISILTAVLKKTNEQNSKNLDVEFDENRTNKNIETNTQESDKIISKLKTVSESERIRIYLGTYFKYIENKNYDSAYNLLYPKFKENYFPTLKSFEEYIKGLSFPEMLSIEYHDIHMQGEYYIVTVRIGDLLSRSASQQEKSFILQENGYNDFYISFKK